MSIQKMTLFSKATRLYFTIKTLRFEQIWFRILRRVFPLRKLKGDFQNHKIRKWEWNSPEFMSQKFFSENEVEFLNQKAFLNELESWNDKKFEKLWLYNLHYFDDLNAVESSSRMDIQRELLNRWIDANPPVSGNGWEPYPLSLRIVNWIKWSQRTNYRDQKLTDSLAYQAEALNRQLEYHIFGNHLFANAKALIFIGCFFEGIESNQYLQKGLKILEKEIEEQFLSDGGHFELSPMYHNILLWDLLDLINLAQINSKLISTQYIEHWKNVAIKALQWIGLMIHPDGEVSFFNDSAIGIAAPPEVIFDYAKQLGLDFESALEKRDHLPLITLKESGYTRIKQNDYVLFFDHAEIGPDYLPAHGHADALSIECSVGVNRFIVNSGTSIYGLSDERLRQRKTPAHSTVVVDDEDSSEVWSGFRVARRAYICDLNINKKSEKQFCISASHDGYKRLGGGVNHHRIIKSNVNRFEVVDRLNGKYASAYAVFHLHPDVVIENSSSSSLKLILKEGVSVLVSSSSSIYVETSSWHPRFGQTIESICFKVPFDSNEIKTKFTIMHERIH